jgi:hypothetical protein
MRGPASFAQQATDLWLATAGERGNTPLAQSVPVRVKNHLPELGAALANQSIGMLGPLGDLSLESHNADSNYYRTMCNRRLNPQALSS